MSNPPTVWITVRCDDKIAAIPVTEEFLSEVHDPLAEVKRRAVRALMPGGRLAGARLESMDGAEARLDQPEIQHEIVGDLEIWSQFQFRLVVRQSDADAAGL